MLTDEELATLLAGVDNKQDHRFAAKLTRIQRREAYALVLAGFSHGVVAQTFGVNKSTIGHMVRRTSKLYGDVRDEHNSYGDAGFMQRYLNPTLIERANIKKRAIADPATPEGKADRINPKADKHEGVHNYMGSTFWVVYRNLPHCHGWTVVFSAETANDETNVEAGIPSFATSSQAYADGKRMVDIGWI